MIICKNLKKSYNETTILNDFSYSFNNKGLYVLYGVSGSGKTTFLQMLLGITEYDKGEIIYDDISYEKKVSYKDIQKNVAYITQDSYFIDYLTMEENLFLQSNKSHQYVTEIVEKFKLKKLLKKYPKELSGGERQRFSLIGNILKEKSIFILDEPTSSLDKNNKYLLYAIINVIKDKCLVICSSHDESIFFLECEKIDFNIIDSYTSKDMNIHEKTKKKKEKQKINYLHETKVVLTSLYKQILRSEKLISFLFILCFTFVLLMLFLCTDYHTKLINSLINNHNINGTVIFCSVKSDDNCSSILKKYGASEVVYDYIRNIPEESTEIDGLSTNNYEYGILSLPFDKKNLNNIDKMLLYGSYFKNKNDVLMGYQEALDLASAYGVSLEELIGEEITFTLPSGDEKFNISGIFKKMGANDITYLKAIIGQYNFDDYYYINGKYNERYLKDNVLGISETNDIFPSIALSVYFPNSEKFINFYNDYIDKNHNKSLIKIVDPVNNFVEYYNSNEFAKTICLVTSSCFIILGMIFYYQLHKTRISYTEQNYSIFEYYGYSDLSVKVATSIYFISMILGIIIISSLVAFFLSIIFNSIVLNFYILPFPLFVFSKAWVTILLIIVLIISIIESIVLNITRKHKGWFYLIKEKSDLI